MKSSVTLLAERLVSWWAASEYLKENKKEEVFFDRKNKEHYMNHMFHGFDMDRTMLRIGAMNMMTHGVDNPYIEYRDSLSDQNPDRDMYSLILANPPFKGSLDYDIVSQDLLKVAKTKKTELLFLVLFLKMLENRRKMRLYRTGWSSVWFFPKLIRRSEKNWWKKIVWRQLSPCLPVCLNLMQESPLLS